MGFGSGAPQRACQLAIPFGSGTPQRVGKLAIEWLSRRSRRASGMMCWKEAGKHMATRRRVKEEEEEIWEIWDFLLKI